MKFPVNGQWKVDQSSDRGLNILATKNIQFNEQGLAALSNRTITMFDEDDDSDLSGAFAVYSGPDITKLIGNDNDPFTLNLTSLPWSITDDDASNHPTGSEETSAVMFNKKWRVTENDDMASFDPTGPSWADESLSPGLTGARRHPVCVHKGNNSLLIGNGPQVLQFDTSLANTVNLTIEDTGSNEVCGIAYNRSLAGVVTWDSKQQQAWLYIWDAATAAANYAYPLGSSRAFWIVPWKDTFACLTGAGELLAWSATGLDSIAALPSFYTSAVLGSISTRSSIAHDTSALVDRKRILFAISAYAASKGSQDSVYNALMPGGIYAFDEAIGLYHRHAPSSTKVRQTTFTNPGPSDNAGIIPADIGTYGIPNDGTPFMFMSTDGKSPTPLKLNTIYYSYSNTSGKFQACASRTDALDGTFITITDTDPSIASYKLMIFPESDFGQLASPMFAGVLAKTGPQQTNSVYTAFSIFERYLFSFFNVDTKNVGTQKDILGIVMDRCENRGWILTQKLYSPNVVEIWNKLFVKARNLYTDLDKVIVKYRTNEKDKFPIYVTADLYNPDNLNWYGKFTADDEFVTDFDLSDVKADFDSDDKKYEIEIVNGAGSGYLAHITNITEAGGTYTITLDEHIRNIAVDDTFYFVVHNFEKLQTTQSAEQLDFNSDPDFGEFPIPGNSKWIQFRIELRGLPGVALEEMELVNTGDKNAV